MSALLALLLAATPQGRATYRAELAGVHVGMAELALSCAGAARPPCTVRWSTRMRLPALAGGELRERRLEAPFDPVDCEVPLPASAAEVVLGAEAGPERRCRPAVDEETGRRGQACARREGAALALEVLGVEERVVPGADGLPERVELPGQRMLFVRDAAAAVPAAAPPLDVRVRAGAGAGASFCGRRADPAAALEAGAGVPPVVATGEACQVQAEAYAAAARRAGWPARVALGVAHDGRGFVWHAWAELQGPAGWLAVDPAFGQRPARGPRFTVARLVPGDAASRQQAGEAILACWGRAVE
ncbi:MAG: transglutaminase domain-containing protein [Anaeromyxobacter sp.]